MTVLVVTIPLNCTIVPAVIAETLVKVTAVPTSKDEILGKVTAVPADMLETAVNPAPIVTNVLPTDAIGTAVNAVPTVMELPIESPFVEPR